MDRIKKALDRAKSSRAAKAAQASAEPQHGSKKSVVCHNSLENIYYTNTKVIKVPKRVQKENHLISSLDSGPELDAYKILRTNVLKVMKANNWSSLAVTSSRPGEGKSLTAINLAICIAKEVNHTVLLVDLDLRSPSIHKFFGYYPQQGISEVITNNVPVEDILINPGIERLVVLPGNKEVINSSEAFSTPDFVKMIAEIKSRYANRYVIFDLPPVLGMDDALVFSEFVDAYLLVIENGKTKEEELKRVYDILGSTNVIGTVLNKSNNVQKKFYSYGY